MLENNEKIRVTFTKDMMIRKIAEACGINAKIVKSVYNAFEDCIFETLSLADLNKDISLRLFEGITIDSCLVPEKTKVNNLTGETITASRKIKTKANVTRNYCSKLTCHNK